MFGKNCEHKLTNSIFTRAKVSELTRLES